ncbi:hypothetical protein [Tabrizicola soli]|uniref:Uncharacterized protein n=1 Tax=Tabrizicola soli TaxID=2185115 RepID=A0ABV7E1M4_9RHOB|nr:hypothetical protein [Tabrizicola soli]
MRLLMRVWYPDLLIAPFLKFYPLINGYPAWRNGSSTPWINKGIAVAKFADSELRNGRTQRII